jgi:hypothetical protein
MNLHSQVALFYELKGANFRHVGCEIKSKQGVSFGIIFSRNALNGAIGKNPFDFQHYKINFVALNIDGRQIPTKPLQPDFENNGYIRSYMGLYKVFI